MTIKKNKKKKTVIITTDKNENLDNKNNINNINEKNSMKKNKGKPITIIFRFQNEKELFLDTDDCKIFKDILQDFDKKYNIKISNIIYNDMKIDINKTPNFYKMKQNSYINVLDELDI